MEQSDLIVRRIKDGTVIDHINEGKGLKVLEALEIDGSRGNVSLPNQIEQIFRCSNPDCITNSQEHIESTMEVMDKENLVLKCRYCGRVLDVDDLRYQKKN